MRFFDIFFTLRKNIIKALISYKLVNFIFVIINKNEYIYFL